MTSTSSIISDDPDKLLSEWLGELENLIGGLELSSPSLPLPQLRPKSNTSSERTDSYRFSMANLEETHEAELDAILGELSLLEHSGDLRQGRCHSRSNSTISGVANSTISTISTESGVGSVQDVNGSSLLMLREPRTESPDNDSAFSDTVSLLSSESSSASSGISSAHSKSLCQPLNSRLPQLSSAENDAKAAKIHLALQKLEQASVRRLFLKAFSLDGASKSLLVDERMTCGHVTRLLADKNHVQMEPHWALVEHLPDLQMERLFEDHELLVDNLMLWSRDSKNRVLFLQRRDKVALFSLPEQFLPGTQMAPGSDHDEHTRAMLLDEFFTTGGQISMEGPLYLKSDSKKGWKRYHFVLRASGLYYYPKEKTRSSKDLLCLALFAGHDIYKGLGWKKKHKAPTDFTLALKCPKAPPNAKGVRSVKMLCVDDNETLEKWITAIRVAKYGRSLYDNHKGLLEELAREELDKLSSARSGSIGSIVSSVPSQCSNGSGGSGGGGNISLSGGSNGRVSRASSSSSSGCLSDDNNGFDSEFPTGTIKRKPSMKPNLPLTSMTRQLKEVGETTANAMSPTSPEKGGTLTRRHSRKRSEESNGSGTLKRRPNAVGIVATATHRGSIESMNSSQGTITPTPGTPTMLNGAAAALKEATHSLNNSPLSPLAGMPQSMTDSTFSLPPPPDDMGGSLSASMLSLNSLPPPPLPSELLGTDTMHNGLSNSADHDVTGSQMSLISLPPPPPDVKPIVKIFNKITTPEKERKPCIPASPIYETTTPATLASSSKLTAEAIYGKTIKPSLKAPPYKAPPPYNNGAVSPMTPPAPPSATKSVSFADSPVLLRRKVSFDIDQVQSVVPLSPKRASSTCSSRDSSTSGAPPPPPRAEATRLSTSSVGSPPRRLADSQSNPPRDFLKDLQRVMRKKWQVAQKCKLEPATTPHEVLGFRDAPLMAGGDTHYYRETSNVSNWLQEHYGMDSLYENLGTNQGLEPVYPVTNRMTAPAIPNGAIKKRPPPPPPKRSEKTQLTTTHWLH